MKAGPVTNSIYYCNFISLSYSLITKEAVDGSTAWSFSFNSQEGPKSLSIDNSETYLYFDHYSTPYAVLILNATDGTIVSSKYM